MVKGARIGRGIEVSFADSGYYVWNGTEWKLRFGDTGWLLLAPYLQSGWTAGAEVPYLRVRNGVTSLVGRVNGTAAAGSAVSILPEFARPQLPEDASQMVVTTEYNGAAVRASIAASGAISALTKTNTTMVGWSLAGLPRFEAAAP